jgi:hypothetical protein
MTEQTIEKMTVQDLVQLIDARIEAKIQDSQPERTIQEVNASIRRHRFTPPQGSMSSLQMLREDRDR